ncbi:MAG: hypothetical protein LBQ54_15540, partial [Planctomycetaceae bacterium]|nr:hypothetical protein [Planctomycetaceae bacterium]
MPKPNKQCATAPRPGSPGGRYAPSLFEAVAFGWKKVSWVPAVENLLFHLVIREPENFLNDIHTAPLVPAVASLDISVAPSVQAIASPGPTAALRRLRTEPHEQNFFNLFQHGVPRVLDAGKPPDQIAAQRLLEA